MAGEKQVVADIRNFLDSGSRTPSQAIRDLAEQYNDLCVEANRRLRQCEDYLNKGMRTEAIHLAEVTPSIMELAAGLHFHGIELWRRYCKDHDLPSPPPIASAVVSRLNQAYVQEESLAGLMSEYRRTAHQGALAPKISLLRRIARLDPENEHWREDLVSLERARHEELASEVEAAVEAGDTQRMELLQSEIASPEWSVPPPPELSVELERCMDTLRHDAAAAEGKKIARRVAHGYSALNFDRTRRALRRWRALLSAGDFEPAAETARQVAEAAEWVEDEERKRGEETQFRGDLRALTVALDRAPSLEKLERLVYAVNRHDREIPPALRERIERALGDARLAARRQFRIRMVAVAALIAGVAIPLLLLARHSAKKRERVRWVERIDAARTAKDYAAAANLLAEVESRSPGLFSEPELQERVGLVQKEAAEFLNEREEFDRAMTELETIRDAGFPPDSHFSLIEETAREYAHTTDEMLRFQDWLAARESRDERIAADANRRLDAVMSHIMMSFKRLENLDPELEHEAWKPILEKVREDFKDARSISHVSDVLREQLDDLNKKALVVFGQFEQAAERLARKKELLAELAKPASDLAAYEARASAFAVEFANHPEASNWQAVARECRLGADLLRPNAWPVGDYAMMSATATQFLAAPESKDSMWREPMEWLAHGQSLAPAAQEAVKAIEEFKNNWRFYDVCSFTSARKTSIGMDKPKRYYYLAPPEKSLVLVTEGREQYKYSIKVFGKEHQEGTRTFSTMDQLSLSDNALDNLAPHCTFLRRVWPQIRQAPAVELRGILLRAAEELRRLPETDPVVKVLLMQAFLKHARAMSLTKNESVGKALEQLGACNKNVFWMDPEPDGITATAKSDAAETLARIKGLAEAAYEAAFRDAVSAASLSRKPRYVGVLTSGEKETITLFDGEEPLEIWIVSEDALGRAAVQILAERDAEGGYSVLPSMENFIHSGRPLFAPGDERRTRAILGEIRGRLREFSEVGAGDRVQWPGSWPLNARGPAGT